MGDTLSSVADERENENVSKEDAVEVEGKVVEPLPTRCSGRHGNGHKVLAHGRQDADASHPDPAGDKATMELSPTTHARGITYASSRAANLYVDPERAMVGDP